MAEQASEGMSVDVMVADLIDAVERQVNERSADAGVQAVGRAILAAFAALSKENKRLREREQHFARALSVADGGQYRNDWDAAITRVITERERAERERDELKGLLMQANQREICILAEARCDEYGDDLTRKAIHRLGKSIRRTLAALEPAP